jgi:hypothetical protein
MLHWPDDLTCAILLRLTPGSEKADVQIPSERQYKGR